MATTKTPAKRAAKAPAAMTANAVQASNPTNTVPAPGQYWPEQNAFYAGIVCQPDGQAWHLLLPDGAKFNTQVLAWGEYGQDVSGATSIYDGQANTAAMLAAGSPAAKAAKKLGDDVYLPARAEALLLFATLKVQFPEGGYHWTSTQYSEDYAWLQDFYYGGQYGLSKGNERRCRFVRRLVLQSFNPSV